MMKIHASAIPDLNTGLQKINVFVSLTVFWYKYTLYTFYFLAKRKIWLGVSRKPYVSNKWPGNLFNLATIRTDKMERPFKNVHTLKNVNANISYWEDYLGRETQRQFVVLSSNGKENVKL